MNDDCLLALYDYLTPEARRAFDALAKLESTSQEQLKLQARLTTQDARKAVWGLSCTSLIDYQAPGPLRLSANGRRLVALLAARQ